MLDPSPNRSGRRHGVGRELHDERLRRRQCTADRQRMAPSWRSMGPRYVRSPPLSRKRNEKIGKSSGDGSVEHEPRGTDVVGLKALIECLQTRRENAPCLAIAASPRKPASEARRRPKLPRPRALSSGGVERGSKRRLDRIRRRTAPRMQLTANPVELRHVPLRRRGLREGEPLVDRHRARQEIPDPQMSLGCDGQHTRNVEPEAQTPHGIERASESDERRRHIAPRDLAGRTDAVGQHRPEPETMVGGQLASLRGEHARRARDGRAPPPTTSSRG